MSAVAAVQAGAKGSMRQAVAGCSAQQHCLHTMVVPSSPAHIKWAKHGVVSQRRSSRLSVKVQATAAAEAEAEPLMVRAAKGQKVERAPCWMMRQAGRYQKAYRDLAIKYPSFRERSETTDLIVEITLQPWRSFKPDGIILFSDILTPLPAIGMDFEIDDNKGPILENPIRSIDRVKALHPIELDKLSFVGEALTALRKEVGNQTAVLGFVGSPWTLATYMIEGGSTALYKTIKGMTHTQPELLAALLSHLAAQMAQYIRFQIDSGAQYVQIFDSWGGQLPPRDWDVWSGPYIKQVVSAVKQTHPHVPLTLYANGSAGLLERIKRTGVDVVGLDWTVDMADARTRLGHDITVQGNVDPMVLFSTKDAIESAVKDVISKAGTGRHILNLGHGVVVGTPEENVGHMFDLSKQITYASLQS